MSMMTCDNPCPYGQYLYPNGTCQNTCPQGYLWSYNSTISGGTAATCSFPCGSNQYLYQDGNCSATCRPDFIEMIDSNNNRLCNFPCYYSGGVLYENGTCSYNCPLDFVYYESWFGFCRFPCASNQYYSNGRCTPSCEVGSTPRIEGSYRFCDSNTTNIRTDAPCSSENFYKYQNGSCLGTCPLPLLSTWQGSPQRAYCTYPCSPGDYLYPNTSCLSDCEPGFIPRIDGKMYFCDYSPPNPPVSNSTTSCLFPLSTVWEDGNAFCRSPCGSDAFLYPNGTCSFTCDKLWHIVIEESIQYCKPPCPSGQYIYSYNNACISTCEQPRKPSLYYDISFCDDVPLSDCEIYNAYWYGDGYYQANCYNPYNDCDKSTFEYEDGSCVAACRYPMIPEIRNMSAFCVKDPNYTGPDNTTCWPWEFTYPNGSCLPNCNRPYASSWQNAYFCNPQCSADMYAYDNGNCLSTCGDRFIAIETDGYKYCKFPCDSSQYLLPDGSCSYFCLSGIYEVLNNTFMICDPNRQTSCGTYEYNGQIRTNCSNPDTICGPELFQYEDNTCADSCTYPYTPLIANFSAYCVVNITNTTNPNNQTNTTDPSENNYCEVHSSLYSATTNCTNPSNNCAQNQFQYTDGHCDYYCYYPQYYSYISNFSAYCIVNSTNPNNQTNTTNPAYCKVYSTLLTDTTNCTNPSNTCMPDEFEYSDAHCDFTCNHPLYYSYISDYSAYCARNTSNANCETYDVGDYYIANCPNPNTECGEGQFVLPNYTCTTRCYPPYFPYISDSIAYCLINTTDTTDPPENYYCEERSSLSHATTNCSNPFNNCGPDQFEYADGHCDYYCYYPQYYSYISNFSAFCVANSTNTNTTNPNNQTNTTNPSYCEIYSFGDSYTNDCSNPDHGCDEGEFLRSDSKCSFTCDYPSIPYISGSTAYCNVSQTDNYCEVYSQGKYFTTNCTNHYNWCDVGQFLLNDSSCSCTCTSPSTPYIANFSAYCISATSPSGCLPGQLRYYNGTCTSNCAPPLLAEYDFTTGSGSCSSPCYYGSYYNEDLGCLDSCDSPYVVSGEAPYLFCNAPPQDNYCEIHSTLYNDTNNCTNPSNNCAQNQFQYIDGHCDYACYHPQYYSYISNFSAYCVVNSTYTNTTNPNNQTNTTNPSCEIYSFGGSYTNDCTNPDHGCDEGEFLRSDYKCSFTCDYPSVPYISGSSAYCNVSQTDNYCEVYSQGKYFTTNCTNQLNLCDVGQFLLSDGNCSCTCTSPSTPYIANFSAYCIPETGSSGCLPGQLMYYNGSCTDNCPPPLLAGWDFTTGIGTCIPPCSMGYYYQNDSCIDSCDSPYVPSGEAPYLFCNAPQGYYCEKRSNLYNSTNNCTNPSNNCGQDQFQYPDGHCDYYCYHPQYFAYISNLSAYCLLNNTYTNTTNPNNQTNTTNPHYCKIYSNLLTDTTNCTNPSNTCIAMPGTFEYPDAHCDYTCNQPLYYSYISDYSAYCARNTSYADCQTYYVGDHYIVNCPNSGTWCGEGQFVLPNYNCTTRCYPPDVPYISGSVAYCLTNQTNTTNTTDPSQNNYCEIYSSTNYSTTNCTNPSNSCEQGQFLYADGHCGYYCSQPSYYPYIFNFSAYCAVNSSTTNPNNQTNNTGTVSLQIYIRYNMSLIDFNSQDGLNRFIQQLSLILGVDPSDIVILDVREGSTIIESAVVLTSESDQSSMNAGTSRAQEMSNRYSSAIGNQQLNLFSGVDILDSRQSVQVSTPSTASVSEVLSSKSSSGSAVGIGVGAGLAALFVAVGGYWLYRRYRARKDVRSANTESNVVRENANQNDQEANDGMSVKNVNETELKPKISSPQGLELGQERDISFQKKMKDSEKIGQQQEQGQEQEQQDDDNEEIPISLDAILNLDKIDINIAN